MSAINLIEKAKELQSLIENAVKSSPQLPPKPKEYIADTYAHLSALVERLKHISDNWVELTNLESQQKDMLRNVEHWDAIQPGVIKEECLDDLVKNHSATLKGLYQGAIDILQVVKFNDKELSIAAEIGDKFSVYQEGWSSFKRALAPNGNGINRVKNISSIDEFLDLLARKEIITDYRLHFLKYEKGGQTRWKRTKANIAERLLPPNHEIMFEFDGFDSKLSSFLTGNWFNAYAYLVFADQLKRLDSDYEIYSMVKFRNKAYTGERTGGDFDLIVNIGKCLLLVECKSGRIVRDNERDDFEEIREKTETLKVAFKNTRVTDYTFLLLFNPDAADPRLVHNYFDPLGIKVVTPGDIRGVVIDVFRNL